MNSTKNKTIAPSPQTISNHFIEELIRGIEHDIGAPARHVVHFSDMLAQSDLSDLKADKQQRWLNILNDSGHKIQNMIQSLATLTSLSHHSSQRKTIDLKDIYGRLLPIILKGQPNGRLPPLIKAPASWPTITGSEYHWQTLMACLLDNALKFQPLDESHQTIIEVTCVESEEEVRLAIKDNGIGIREGQRESIFRPFKRLNKDTDYAGLGMGLTFVKYIQELNNGEIQIESDADTGVTVTYRQPHTTDRS